jgi:hypothetical protein
MPYLKIAAVNDDGFVIEGYGVPFGGPIKGRDMHGQFFSKNTDFALDLIPDGQRPLLYQHGLDKSIDTMVIGRWGVKRIDDGGVWVQAQLNARSEYINEIKELIDQDALGFSSGTMGHLVQVSGKTGEILKWALVELSLTPNPANPNAYIVKQQKSAKAYVKSLMEGEVETTAAEPAVDPLKDALAALVAGTITEEQAMVLTKAIAAALPQEDETSASDAAEDTAEGETEMAKSVSIHVAAAAGLINAVKCGEMPVALLFDALSDILENLDKTHGMNEESDMESEGHEDEAADRGLINQVIDERAAIGKSRKHGDHDQSEHGNWATGGGSSRGAGDALLRDAAHFRMTQVTEASRAAGVHEIDVRNMQGYADHAKEAHAAGDSNTLHNLAWATTTSMNEWGNTKEPNANAQRKFALSEIGKQIHALGKDLDPNFHGGSDYRGFDATLGGTKPKKTFRIRRS